MIEWLIAVNWWPRDVWGEAEFTLTSEKVFYGLIYRRVNMYRAPPRSLIALARLLVNVRRDEYEGIRYSSRDLKELRLGR